MLCAGLTYAGPAQRAEGSHFSSGSKSADELILMEELDAVGDALKGLLGVGGGVGALVHPGPGETDAAMKMSILGVVYLVQIFGVLAQADSLLSLPVTVWEPGLSGSNGGPVI